MSALHEIELDLSRPLVEDEAGGHNRWHAEIGAAVTVEPGDELLLDVRDGIDCQVTRETRHADILAFDMLRGHPMTGPVEVAGAEPGDLLEVEILAIEPGDFGSTPVVPGFGMLGDLVTEPFVVRWEIEDGAARSDDLPGVRIPARPFLGVLGVAPAAEQARRYEERERGTAERGAVVLGPDARSAVPAGNGLALGLRTIPPRENGGNLDLRQAGAGATVSVPVQVPGALLSVGDPHFAQGDGEVCGFAVETSARAHLRVGLRKAGELRWRPRMPTVAFEGAQPASGPCVSTTGISLTEAGANGDLDINAAARMALREMSELLTREHGLSFNQAYALMSVAVDLRISEGVNTPNALVSAVLPLAIFDERRNK